MTVKFMQPDGYYNAQEGDIKDIDNSIANTYIKLGKAEEVSKAKAETATAKAKTETATL